MMGRLASGLNISRGTFDNKNVDIKYMPVALLQYIILLHF